MTYRRDPNSFAGALTRIASWLGENALAEALGVSAGRVRQCANPMTGDELPFSRCVAADVAAARAGLGTPLYDEFRRQLAAAGALGDRAEQAASMRARRLANAVRRAVAELTAALVMPAAPLEPQPVRIAS